MGDIEDADSIQALYDQIMIKYGGVDILINNAGVMMLDSEKRPFNEKVDMTMNINFTSTKRMTEKFFPAMKPHGRMVMVSSEAGSIGSSLCSDDVRANLMRLDEAVLVDTMNKYVKVAKEGTAGEHGLPDYGDWTPYLVSKTGVTLLGMIYGLKAGQLGNGLLVNACCPGLVDTDMSKDLEVGLLEKKSCDEGADTPVYLALLPKGCDIQGRFIADRKDKTDIFIKGKHPLPKTNQ